MLLTKLPYRDRVYLSLLIAVSLSLSLWSVTLVRSEVVSNQTPIGYIFCLVGIVLCTLLITSLAIKYDFKYHSAIKSGQQKREQLAQLPMDATDYCLCEWDLITNRLRCHLAWTDFPFPLSPNPIILIEHFFETIHRNDKARVQEVFNHLKDGKYEQHSLEVRIKVQSGQWKWTVLTAKVSERNKHDLPIKVSVMLTDVSDRKRVELELWRQANYDKLTSCPNHTYLKKLLRETLEQSNRDGLVTALFLIDIDNFRDINQAFGTQKGDTLLKQIAERVRKRFGSDSLLSRQSSDEFTLIVHPLSDLDQVKDIGESLLNLFSSPFYFANDMAFVTASIGIDYCSGHQTSFDTLMENASQALYASKDIGTNSYRVYSPDICERNLRRVKLQNDLRQALSRNELEVLYQPIIRLSDNSIKKAEALLRWHHSDLGLISPDEFIPLAESSGQISTIGDWVFSQAIQHASLCRYFVTDFQISINKSPVQLRELNGNQHNWLALLNNAGLPGNLINVEITEGLLLDKNFMIDQQMSSLKQAGISISIDDFGTGYSSLAYLSRYDIDYLKIDKSFIDEIDTDPKKLVLCKAIINMAKELKIQVIAEGVETERQVKILNKLGCDYAQGFYFSRPVKASLLIDKCTHHIIDNNPPAAHVTYDEEAQKQSRSLTRAS